MNKPLQTDVVSHNDDVKNPIGYEVPIREGQKPLFHTVYVRRWDYRDQLQYAGGKLDEIGFYPYVIMNEGGKPAALHMVRRRSDGFDIYCFETRGMRDTIIEFLDNAAKMLLIEKAKENKNG